MTAEQGEIIKITVPTILEVPKALIEGDPSVGIRFEVIRTDGFLSEIGMNTFTEYMRQVLEKGARVFIDENDLPLIIHSDESAAFRDSIGRK